MGFPKLVSPLLSPISFGGDEKQNGDIGDSPVDIPSCKSSLLTARITILVPIPTAHGRLDPDVLPGITGDRPSIQQGQGIFSGGVSAGFALKDAFPAFHACDLRLRD